MRARSGVLALPALLLLGVAAAVLWPSGAAAQSTEPEVACFEITAGWSICAAPPEPATPCKGVACIEPAPGAFERRTFATGERIHWPHGIFVLDPETGETEGYRRSVLAYEVGPPVRWLRYHLLPDGWIRVGAEIGTERFQLLLHRATAQSWRWPSDRLSLVATSGEYLLFEERGRSSPAQVGRIGRFTITNRAMEAVGHFSIGVDGHGATAVFSPDGQTIALDGGGDTVYLVPVATAQPTVLFKAEATDDQVGVWLDWLHEGPHIRIFVYYETAGGDRRREQQNFNWGGAPLPGAPLPGEACPGRISPDGRYAAWLVGGYVVQDHHGTVPRADPWPSLVIADAATCTPLFRVRSARTHGLGWRADWLSNSAGFVIGDHDGYQIVRIHPTPHLVRLPGRGARLANLGGGGIGGELEGPEPAPTGDGRYFGYGPSVYDAVADRWLGPELDSPHPWAWWGESHRERWFELTNESHGGNEWLLLPPTIELPPFPDAIAFRVAGTGDCLRLRALPGEASAIIGCLPDGARLVLTAPALVRDPGAPPLLPHPAVTLWYPGDDPQMTWVHVRTEDGAEGWVSHDYLEHDIAHRRTFDPTAAVGEPGRYAFLDAAGDVVTTYEGLRDGTATGLRVHTSDAYGQSQAGVYDAVAVGDIFEWWEADDCFVRYTVTEVKTDPDTTSPRKEFAVEWMTYAFTGCSGAISSTATASLQWGPLPDLGGPSLTAPIRHALWQIVPEGWTGETEDPQPRDGAYTEVPPGRRTTIAEARLLPRWRDADLPSGWTFWDAVTDPTVTPFGYEAAWGTEDGSLGIIIRGEQAGGTGFIQSATGRYAIGDNRKLSVTETRMIAGRPAIVSYSPAGPTNDIDFLVRLLLHDPATDSEYTILTYDRSLAGSNVDAVIAIAESLFEPPNAP